MVTLRGSRCNHSEAGLQPWNRQRGCIFAGAASLTSPDEDSALMRPVKTSSLQDEMSSSKTRVVGGEKLFCRLKK